MLVGLFEDFKAAIKGDLRSLTEQIEAQKITFDGDTEEDEVSDEDEEDVVCGMRCVVCVVWYVV